MKKYYFIFFCVLASMLAKAAEITVSTNGLSFSPETVQAAPGDIIIFQVGSSHTATQVSQATWNSNGATPLAGGFNYNSGTHNYTIQESDAGNTIYYVCAPHAGAGMKGQIQVTLVSNRERITGNLQFTVFPSQTSDNLQVKASDLVENMFFDIVDATGKVISSRFVVFSHRREANISVQDLPRGLYFIRPAKSECTCPAKRFFKI
jgi:plastocyanin